MTKVKIISGNDFKNDGGVAAGLSTDRAKLSALTFAESVKPDHDVSHKTPLAVSPAESGLTGSFKPLTAGVYDNMEDGQYLLRGYSTRIAQTNNNVLAGGDSKTPRDMLRYFHQYHRYDITQIDVISSGTVVVGANAGTSVNPVDISTGSQAYNPDTKPTSSVPGELVYRDSSLTPVQDDYNVNNDTLA